MPKAPRLPANVMAPNKARLLELCDIIRDETRPRIAAMISRLAQEADFADQASARVAAAKAVVGYAVQADMLAAELEAGTENKTAGTSNVVVMVVDPKRPDEGPRIPAPEELQQLLADMSESVCAEREELTL